MIDEKYLQDWSGTRYGTPSGVALPRNTAEVAALLRESHETRTAVAIQGGRTGVSGGAAPGDGELVVSLERLNRIEEFDPIAGIAVVGAGVILENLQRQVEAQGWMFPIDLASRGSCQIGGNAATNAGGCRVVKYGNTRESVLGLEAVLANGAVIGPPNRLVKNNAGYSLTGLMIGSEGTLGVITRLALRLVPLPPVRRTVLVALADHVPVDKLLLHSKLALRDALSAFEVMWSDFVEEASRLRLTGPKLPAAFSGKRAVLIEVEGSADSALTALIEGFVSKQIEDGLIVDAVMSTSARDALDLWSIRELVPEIQKPIRPYVGFDLGLPANRHDSFVAAAKVRLAERLPGVRSFFFGHVGDGNLHALVGPCVSAKEQRLAESALYELLTPLSSTATAEHGIGRKKKNYLTHSRSRNDIETMKTLKRALDPNHILNPGRIFDLG
jgi:FAD/FMN-containing dehydrogenase